MILQTAFSFALLFFSLSTAAAPGEQRARVFDESGAKQYLRYARIAFCAQSRVEAWNCGEDCEIVSVQPGSVRFFGPTSTWSMQGYAAQLLQSEAGACIVGVRGSVDVTNWIADAEFTTTEWPFPTSCPGCRVHAGFAKAYADLRPHIFQAVRDLRCRSLVFAGHSLGGAMVTMAAFEARAGYGIHVNDVWTFGKPRVGNANWAQRYIEAASGQEADPPLWRIVHYLDPAGRVPFTALGYLHEHQEVWYTTDESSSFTVCASELTETGVPIEDPTCSIQYWLPHCLWYASDHTLYLNLSLKLADAPLKDCQDGSLAGEEVVIV